MLCSRHKYSSTQHAPCSVGYGFLHGIGPWALQAWSSLLSGSYLTLTHKPMHSLAQSMYFKCAVVFSRTIWIAFWLQRLPKMSKSFTWTVQRSAITLHFTKVWTHLYYCTSGYSISLRELLIRFRKTKTKYMYSCVNSRVVVRGL